MTGDEERKDRGDMETLEPSPEGPVVNVQPQNNPPTHICRVFPSPAGADYCVVPWPIHESLLIGREVVFDGRMFLSDPMVSREHARLRVSGGRVLLEDMGARNGTHVNGVKVVRSTIRINDTIRIGGTLFTATETAPEPRSDLLDCGVVVVSASMAALVRQLEVQAHTSSAVVLVGEPGTGKALLAPLLHKLGSFVGRLVVVDCARWRSERAKESFPDFATHCLEEQARPQTSDVSSRATVVLQDFHHVVAAGKEEEVAGLGPDKLAGKLKTLLGGGLRLAYTVDLRGDVTEDFFRLVPLGARDVVLTVPSLRDRKEDLVAMLWHEMQVSRADPQVRLTSDVVEYILCHEWPDNVEELFQVMEMCLSRQAQERPLQLSLLQELLEPGPESDAPGSKIALKKSPSLLELRLALAETHGNIHEACRRHDWHPRQVYRWAEKYGIKLRGKGRHRSD